MLMFPNRARVLRTLYTSSNSLQTGVPYRRPEFPLFTIENMMNYFIKRKSGDNEGNKDYSGTPLNRTPLRPQEMSSLEGCLVF